MPREGIGMERIRLSLLRGVCQIPAYVAVDDGLFREEGVDPDVEVAATAWMVPARLGAGDNHFAVIPWTRVAASGNLVLLSGSGVEEAVLVVQAGVEPEAVRSVAVPVEGGMKDLTAMGLLGRVGWEAVDVRRFPSGDGAIIAFVGQGVDAASMVEPYASMLEARGMGRAYRRTGDIWPGAPGCSLATSRSLANRNPELVRRVVRAYVQGAALAARDPARAARLASRYIGVAPAFIEKALSVNRPNVDAIRNDGVMGEILNLMRRLGYLTETPKDYRDLSFLTEAQAAARR
jgi:NitT/TauT family transport system substrate-binding protein